VELTAEDIIKIFEQDPTEGLEIGVTLARSIVEIGDNVGLEELDVMHKNYYLLSVLMVYMYDSFVTTHKETLH
jgi:GTPase SAR1 family protein